MALRRKMGRIFNNLNCCARRSFPAQANPNQQETLCAQCQPQVPSAQRAIQLLAQVQAPRPAAQPQGPPTQLATQNQPAHPRPRVHFALPATRQSTRSRPGIYARPPRPNAQTQYPSAPLAIQSTAYSTGCSPGNEQPTQTQPQAQPI
ncbi:uncharacterized protein N7482_010279 [Penicillium canariense]|uniref:Uncharacterized protein n=1 Tax=Penicillium canariense TaxID=189055 RepID=A0A9W9LE88_9EURO|nr:uncharacterized protein N7482_010279 [Penicillium canariense]KAJ5151027.1 hypothetical protein N7482_010279 [Penicillium canariense]